jgi:hypothetical protein
MSGTPLSFMSNYMGPQQMFGQQDTISSVGQNVASNLPGSGGVVPTVSLPTSRDELQKIYMVWF